MMGVGLGASGHTPTMENHSSVNATPSMPGMVPTIKEEAETSADSLTIDVEGGHEDSTINKLKAENDPIESKAWINALRTHVVVPLIRWLEINILPICIVLVGYRAECEHNDLSNRW